MSSEIPEFVPGANPPPIEYLPGSLGLPAEGLHPDFSSVPKPTDGPHVVQKFGPRLLDQGTDRVVQPFFEYSRATGNRKALLVSPGRIFYYSLIPHNDDDGQIGINYYATPSARLAGCVNDAKNVMKLLIDRFGYSRSNIALITDDPASYAMPPEKQYILGYMDWLVRGAKRDDALFFHYYDHLVRPLPAGCRLTCIFDSCYSGSIMDIPYCYQPDREIRSALFSERAIADLVPIATTTPSAAIAAAADQINQVILSAAQVQAKPFDTARSMSVMNEANASPADVICWSGCMDTQTSADTSFGGEAVGAMSYAFITCLAQNPNPTYMQLLVAIRAFLQRYTQIVQLSSCHPIDTNLQFIA